MTGKTGRFRDNNGQVAVLVALLLVPLIAISGFVIDVGYAYFAQRSLQSQADAAALAGAQKLPDSSGSISLPATTGAERPPRTTRTSAW